MYSAGVANPIEIFAKFWTGAPNNDSSKEKRDLTGDEGASPKIGIEIPKDATVEIKVLDKAKAEKLGLREAIPEEIHPRDAFLAAVIRRPDATVIKAFSLPDPCTTYIGLGEVDKKIFLNKVRISLGLDAVK